MPRFQFSLRRLFASMLLAILSIQCWLLLGWALKHHFYILLLPSWLAGSASAGVSFGALWRDELAGMIFGVIAAVVLPILLAY